MLDNFSKLVFFLKPIRKANAGNICRYLESDVILLFGVPKPLVSDNGVKFISREFTALLTKYGVQHITTALYSLQANASERVNRSIIAAIRWYLEEDQSQWDANIGSICSVNTHPQVIHRNFQ